MRVQRIILTITAANILSGVLLFFALGQYYSVFLTSCLSFAMAISGLPTVWGINRLRRGIKVLTNQSHGDEQTEVRPTGITDLDAIAGNIVSMRSKTAAASSGNESVQQELEDIKSFLAQIDRRKLNHDRDGQPITAATRLRDILTGYGSKFDPHVQQVIACSREINRCTEQLVSGADEQTNAVDRATSQIEALSSQTLSIGTSAESVVALSATAQESATSSLQKFQQLIDEMTAIQKHVAARERKLRSLGQHSKEIGTIVQTIGTLSSRTDLLSLNASIESVRAGEHGRGFAIVAEEVRALAEQSAKAVLEINSRIELMQLETQESISVASGEHDQMNQLINRVNVTLSSLKQISAVTSDCTTRVSEISHANQQQLHVLQDLVAALERTSNIAKSNRVQAEGVHWTAKSMGQIGNDLNGSLELFRSAGAFAKSSGSADQSPVERIPTEKIADPDQTFRNRSNRGIQPARQFEDYTNRGKVPAVSG